MADPNELLARYASWMRSANWTERTIDMRLDMARTVLKQYPDPDAVTTPDLTEWLGDLRNARTGEPLSRATRATYFSSVRAFFRWLTLVGACQVDPTASPLFQRPKPGRGVPKPLTAAEEAAVLRMARGNTRTWLLLALRAGLRAHEIAQMRGEDVTPDLIYVRGKGEKEAFLPTRPEVWEVAQQYPRVGWWFPSPKHDGHISGNAISIVTGRLFRACGIPKGSIHRARHTYATSLRRQGVDIHDVQKLLRHESLSTTEIYTQVDDGGLRAAVARLPRLDLGDVT